MGESRIGRTEDGIVSHLALAPPVLNVFDVTTATEVNVLASADEHV